MQDFAGQVAIVTGASEGIGLATAQCLAQRGARVVICARRPGKLHDAAKQIKASLTGTGAGGIEAIPLDVGDFAALEAMIHDSARRHGRLDMLVNNAMSVHYTPIESLSLADWQADFAINADAVFVACKAAMAVMAPAGRGAIVNVSSICGTRAAATLASYSASKAALIQFTAVAAMEMARRGVRLNTVVPGQVQTAGNQAFEAMAPDMAARTKDTIPMGRGAEAHEIAAAIAFLLSDAASYITGIALPVDGGKSAQLYLPG